MFTHLFRNDHNIFWRELLGSEQHRIFGVEDPIRVRLQRYPLFQYIPSENTSPHNSLSTFLVVLMPQCQYFQRVTTNSLLKGSDKIRMNTLFGVTASSLSLVFCNFFMHFFIQISRSPKVGRPRNSPANTHVRRKLPLSKFDDDDQVGRYL